MAGGVRRRWMPSRITLRVLAINVLALAILVAGLLYHGEYRRGLIDAEIASLQVHADMVAAALAEGATIGDGGRFSILHAPAQQMVRRLSATTGTRTRLYGPDGLLLADSRRLRGPSGTVEIEPLPPPEPHPQIWEHVVNAVLNAYDWTVDALVDESRFLTYREGTTRSAMDYPETVAALNGERERFLRSAGGERLVLGAAVPVQRYKQVLGAVLVAKRSDAIASALLEVRVVVLKMFGIALAITIALSVYLAGTIARPIRRLSAAAARVRRGHSRQYSIPDFGRRRDEIGDLARALKDMTEALWLRMDAIEAFAADVAHEIKNPLTSLRSAVETAARLDDPDKQRQLMAIIVDDVKRLDRLISDISDASRLDAELSRGELRRVAIADLLRTLVDMRQVTAEDGEGARLSLDVDAADDMAVNGMEDRLVQVFRNLISNADSFTPAGGGIRIHVSRDGGMARIDVIDSGPGIPPGSEEAIFERFYSERPEGETFGTHSGLGLSISRQIVEAHGGTLGAANRTAADGTVQGACFTVHLPLAVGDGKVR